MIELREVTIHSGPFSIDKVSVRIESDVYAVLMGKTGSGKTTILEAICGLRRVSSGQILLNGTDVTRCLPGDRGIGYVPQDLALFPTLSVIEHLQFALKLRRASSETIHQRITELSDVLGIGHLLNRKVRGLSGGESQRVALGRALSFHPSLLLLDEPLSALDESTRSEIQDLLLKIKSSTGATILHITHNLAEAEALADQRYVLENGRVHAFGGTEACGAPPCA